MFAGNHRIMSIPVEATIIPNRLSEAKRIVNLSRRKRVPGVGIKCLTRLASAGYVAGLDISVEMVEQAKARNANGIKSGHVNLRYGSAQNLPFEDNLFDKAIAINSMQVWPDAVTGLREIRRVLKAGASVALGFTPFSGQQKSGLSETLTVAGFTHVRMVEGDNGFCVLATNT